MSISTSSLSPLMAIAARATTAVPMLQSTRKKMNKSHMGPPHFENQGARNEPAQRPGNIIRSVTYGMVSANKMHLAAGKIATQPLITIAVGNARLVSTPRKKESKKKDMMPDPHPIVATNIHPVLMQQKITMIH